MTRYYRAYEVTQEHIDHAVARDSRHCPIADVIALNEPHVRHITVDLTTIRWSDPIKGKRFIFFTPTPAQQFIVDFDRGDRKHVRGFTLRLGAPVQVTAMRIGEHKKYKSGPAKSKTSARLEKNALGSLTKIGGHPIPTNNVQKVRKYGAKALKR